MRRLGAAVLLILVGLLTGLPAAYTSFVASEREVVIGAHEAVVSPNFSGFATIDSGPLIPNFRLDAEVPLGIGVDVRLGETQANSLEQVIAQDALIASQPQGETAAVRSEIFDAATDSLVRGFGVGLLAVLAVVIVWRAVGPERRATLWADMRRPSRRQALTASALVVSMMAALYFVVRPHGTSPADQTSWLPIGEVFDNLPTDPVLERVEISDGTSTRGSEALVASALTTYQASVDFYGKLALTAAFASVRTPLSGEFTALVVTDRHDNIGMDAAARAIADRADARLLIDLGDDTSSGAAWEAFSINSLAREFDGFDVVAVAGNHDTGSAIPEQMKSRGFTVLDGEPVDVGGVRFLGSSDPRSSGLVAGYRGSSSDNNDAIREQDAALTQAACEDGAVSVIAVHSPSSAKQAAASGCVDLVLSGHLHRQVGPETLTSIAGRQTVTLSTGSTGGAVYAFALGSKLRREAQVTVVTFSAEGRPVGVQPVSFRPGGSIVPADYFPITPSPRDDVG